MRVLQLVSDTDRRGAQVFATDLEVALAARGHHVETVALVAGHTGGLAVPAIGGSGARWWSVGVLRRLRSRMTHFDVAIAHGSSTGPASALAGRRCPIVYRQISDSRFWASTRTKRARVRATLRRARLVVTLSEFNRRELVEWIGVASSRIVVVPNGVPAARFTPASAAERAAARAAMGLPDDPAAPIVAFVGALTPEKGADLALRAVAALPGAHLVVAGGGPEARDLERLAREVAPGRVHFVGVVGEAASVYHAADLLVLPSRGGDAMPAVLIEAGLCGLPAVTTAVGAIPEMVLEDETGYVVEPDDLDGIVDRISRLLGDPAGRAVMGDAARAHCLDQFEITRVAEAWEAVLQRAAAQT